MHAVSLELEGILTLRVDRETLPFNTFVLQSKSLCWHKAKANRHRYPLLYHNVVARKGSNNLCHFFVTGVYLLHGGRVQAAQSCLYSPVAPARCSKGLRGLAVSCTPQEFPGRVGSLHPWECLPSFLHLLKHLQDLPTAMGNVYFAQWSGSVPRDIPTQLICFL